MGHGTRGNYDGIIDEKFFGESLDLGIIILVHSCADYDQAFVSKLLLYCDKIRNFFPAGCTPCAPKIQHDDLALVIAQAHRFTIQIVKFKGGGRRYIGWFIRTSQRIC
jgi:hypothetical protein